MQAAVPQLDIARLGLNAISIGQVNIGPVNIGQVVLSGLHYRMATPVAHLQNLRVAVHLAIELDYKIDVEVFSHSGTLATEDIDFAVTFGDVTIPALQDVTVDVANFTVSNVAASSNPLSNLRLGAVVAEQIRARNVVLPSQGFTIAGLTLGSVQATGVGVPAAGVDEVTIGRVHGDAMSMADITVSNLGLPNLTVGDVDSQSIDVSATEQTKVYNVGDDILTVTLKITPTVSTHIDRLHIGNIQASTSIDSISLHNVVAPYEFLNLTLSQIGIDSISIPSAVVS